MLYDHLSFQEKYSVLILYLLKKISRIVPGISGFFFPRPGNLFDHFPGFQGFPGCVGTLGGRPLQYQEGRGSLWFHGMIFPQYIIIKAQSQRNSQNLVRCFRCWLRQYLDLIPTKQT